MFIESAIDAASQQATNASNAAQAQKNRDFQKEMSSTAHQREVKDLKAAGLNPILSAGGGSGASTPSGSTAKMEAPKLNLLQGANSAADTANKTKQADVIKAQADNIDANTKLIESKTLSQDLQNDVSVHTQGMEEDLASGLHSVWDKGKELISPIFDYNNASAVPFSTYIPQLDKVKISPEQKKKVKEKNKRMMIKITHGQLNNKY